MQVELERVGAAGGDGRRRRMVSVALPVAALVLVVSAALLGEGPAAPSPVESPLPVAEAELTADPGAVPRSTTLIVPEDAAAASRIAELEALLPVHAFGLPVSSVTDVEASREAGELAGSLVAIRGYLSPDLSSPNCGLPPLLLETAFCERRMLLASSAAPRVERTETGDVSVLAGARWGSHLHVQALSGVPVPDVFRASQRGSGPVAPVLAVIIGQFDDPRATPCERPRRHCGQEFVLERLAWADGDWIDRTLVLRGVLEDRIVSDPVRPRAISSREADRGETILSSAVIQLDELVILDPEAAELAARTAAALLPPAPGLEGRPVWYLRSVGRSWPGAVRQLTWAVIDHASGLVLATSPEQAS